MQGALIGALYGYINLYLGRELRTSWGTLDDVAMEAHAREVMGRLNPRVSGYRARYPVQRADSYRRLGKCSPGATPGPGAVEFD